MKVMTAFLLATISFSVPTRSAAEVVATPSVTKQGSAPAGPPRFVPTLALEAGTTGEALEVALATGELSDTRQHTNSRVALGLAYHLIDLRGPAIALIGQTSLGVGLRWQTGDWPLHLRQELATRFRLTSWCSIAIGLGTGVEINTGQPAMSYWELGVPLTLRLWFVELQYYPHATLPLSGEERAVFGGTRRQATALAITPLHAVLRFRIEPLGF
jgi:hypothetical protein